MNFIVRNFEEAGTANTLSRKVKFGLRIFLFLNFSKSTKSLSAY